MTNSENQIKKEIILAKDWILSSGIQNTGGRNNGAFNSWFDMDENKYSYAYSEITGYGITMLLYLTKFFNEKKYLTKAISAADWLISNASHPLGGVKTRDYYGKMLEDHLYSFDSEKLYAFDNGMVLYGMINLYRIIGNEKYLNFALKIADFLRNKMMKPDGLFYPIYDAKTGKVEDPPKKWSSQSGSYHAKMALGFTDLFDVTGSEVYKNVSFILCLKCRDFLDKTGRFITSTFDRSTHLHPHAYSCEGLIYTGMYFGKNDFIDDAVSGVKWALDNQAFDGGIPKMFDGEKFITYYRSDTLAQILRLGVILRSIGKLEDKYEECLKKLYERLLSFQCLGENGQKGGFFYGNCLDGSRKKHLNSWCTMFALQALIMYEDVIVKGKRKIETLECFV